MPAPTTELANFAALEKNAAAALSRAIRRDTVLLANGMFGRLSMPEKSMTRTIVKTGKLDAETLPEDTAATISQYNETEVSFTLSKIASLAKLTLEAERFGGENASIQNLVLEQILAITEATEDKLAQVINTFGNTLAGTSGTPLTIADLMAAHFAIRAQSEFSVRASDCVTVLHPTAAYQALKRDQILNNNSSILGFDNELTRAAFAAGRGAGYVAPVAGWDVFESAAITDDGTDYANGVYSKTDGVIGMHDENVTVLTDVDVPKFGKLVGSALFSEFGVYRDEKCLKLLSAV